MPVLDLGTSFPLNNFITEVSSNDAMFDTSEHYLRAGLSALNIIEYAIDYGIMGADNGRTILDLPCGHGRVARVLRSRFPDADLTVCDIDRDGVEFCATKFHATGIFSSDDFDNFGIGKLFDLIWVGSLVTHFNADQAASFIRCMTRHLSPDGLLIVTSHGKSVLRNAALSAAHYGFVYRRGNNGRVSVSNLINNIRIRYRSMSNLNRQFHTKGYGYEHHPHIGSSGVSIISRHWFEGFFAGQAYGLIDYLEQGWDHRQDVLFVKKERTMRPCLDDPNRDFLAAATVGLRAASPMPSADCPTSDVANATRRVQW